MSRPVFHVSGGVPALLAAGAMLFASGTARAGVVPVQPNQLVAPVDSPTPHSSNEDWLQSATPSYLAKPSERMGEFRFSGDFGLNDPAEAVRSNGAITVSLPNPFASSHSGELVGEHVNSIPSLPALWSGLSGFATLLTFASLKRLRRVLRA